jgi:pantoate--beta-alanine ligase
MCKTVRNNNKVALSTRNFLLNRSDIITAGYVSSKLINLKIKIKQNRMKSKLHIKNTKIYLIKKFNIKIEYLEARNTVNLNSNIINKNFKVFIAYYINNVRLIDNF